MAVFSKVLSGGGGNYRLDLTVNQSSQSIPNNTSVVSWSLVIYKTAGSGYWSYNTASWNVNIGGQTRSGTISGYDFRNYSSLTLGSGTVTINHNSDGTKTIANSGYFSGDIGSGTASGNLALSTIPRASSIGNISGNMIGSPVTVPINRASSSFTHTVNATFGSYSTTLTGQGTSAVFTPPLDWARAIPNGTSGTGTITLTTYNGSTQIGSSVSKNFTLNVPASVVPSFTTISHSEYVTDVANKVGSYVQRVSRLNMAITGATGSYGSTISSYKITFAGQTLNAQSGVTQTIASNGTLTATGTITDSRGRTATKSVSIYVFAYDFPKISSVAVERCNSDGTINAIGTYVKVTLSASVSSLIVSSVQKNSLKYTIQSKQRGTSSYTTKVAQQLTAISYSGNSIVATYSIDYAFDFNVLVNDIFNTTTSIGVVSTGKVTMQWGEDWISVGKTHERGSGDFMGQIYQNDGKRVLDESDIGGGSATSGLYGKLTKINTDGVMEVGQYIDFHNSGTNVDYTARLQTDGTNQLQIATNGRILTTGNVVYVVESGSNYMRWSDGTQECWGVSLATYSTARYLAVSVDYPKAFIRTPIPLVTSISSYTTETHANAVPKASTSNTALSIRSFTTSGNSWPTNATQYIYWFAKGQWK